MGIPKTLYIGLLILLVIGIAVAIVCSSKKQISGYSPHHRKCKSNSDCETGGTCLNGSCLPVYPPNAPGMRTIMFQNQTPEKLYVAMLGTSDTNQSALEGDMNGFKLAAGAFKTYQVPDDTYSGRAWARTGCKQMAMKENYLYGN